MRKKSLTIYLEPELFEQFEGMRSALGRDWASLKQTQLGEIAIRRLLRSFRDDPQQLQLDLRERPK